MKIKQKLIGSFFLLLFFTLGITSYLLYKNSVNNSINLVYATMHQDIKQRALRIENFQDRAKSDLLLALNYPLFIEYFELPETKAGNVYVDGIIQFTPNQREIKNKLDVWIKFFQNRFSVDETCLIDGSGQEHTRLTSGIIAPDDDFSSEEDGASFFAPSMAKSKGEVHIEYPYMSPDSNRWVFAYTSPIVLSDGSKPSFFHFELPMLFFQKTSLERAPEKTRIIVLDPAKGLILADTAQNIETGVKELGDIEKSLMTNYFPSINTISTGVNFNTAIADMKAGKEGSINITMINGEEKLLAYGPLTTFGWSVLEIRDSGESGVAGVFGGSMLIILITVFLLDLIIIIIVTRAIVRPIESLTESASKISRGEANVMIPEIKTKDEIHDLAEAMKGVLAAVEFLRDEIDKKK
ncbi:MAG: cache and HAMP domain-containing protein [Patescibacteria group bacterium]